MADKKLSQLTALSALSSDDILLVTDDPSGTAASKSITVSKLLYYKQTADESSAGVTPTDYSYMPGNVIRYGATGDGVTDDSSSIQDALDIANTAGGGVVTVPVGIYLVNTALTVYGGTILGGSGSGNYFSTFASNTGTIIRAGASITSVITTDENSGTAGNATIENLTVDGANLATNGVLMQGIKDTLRGVHVVRGLTYGVHQNVSGVGEQNILDTTITMDSRGTGLYVEAGSDNNYVNVIVHGAYTGCVLEAGGHQFTNFHPYPSPLDAGDASHVCLLDIGAAGDNYFLNCHFDQVHTSGQFQVRISTDNVIAATSPGSALENVFVGCSFDNPNADIDDVVSGVYMDASAGTNKWITASFTECHFSGNGTYKYQYAFEKEGTNPNQIIYHVVGGWANNTNALWSHDPDSVWGFQHLSGGITEVTAPQGIVSSLAVTNDLVVTDDLTVSGKLITPDAGELTISSGSVTITGVYHTIDTEGDASTDNLNNINGASSPQLLIITAENSTRTVVVKDGTGNMQLAGDFSMDHAQDTMTLFWTGSLWKELSRSDNAA